MENEAREGAIEGGRGEELDVGAEVVLAGAAHLAHATREAGLQRHTIADLERCHTRAQRGDDAGALVAQDDGALHLEGAALPVRIVMDVAAAHADGADLHHDLILLGLGEGTLLQHELLELGEDDGLVGLLDGRHARCGERAKNEHVAALVDLTSALVSAWERLQICVASGASLARMLHEFDEVELDTSSGDRESLVRRPMACEHIQSLLIAVLSVAVVFTVLALALTSLIGGAVRPSDLDQGGLKEEPRQTASPAPHNVQPTIQSTLAPVTEAPPSPPPDTQEIITLPPLPSTTPPPTSEPTTPAATEGYIASVSLL